MELHKLPRAFYLRPALVVARDLLGRLLVRNLTGRLLVGRIVEVEAYLGEHDPASHAYRGPTERNEVMFRAGGHLYVYFTYGMHFCSNVVTGPQGKARAVLLRAVEPLEGIDVMRKNRPARTDDGNLANGPAKLCQAFAIGRKENGTDLLGGDCYIARGEKVPPSAVAASMRIGVTAGRDKLWRFSVAGNRFVSRPDAAPARGTGPYRRPSRGRRPPASRPR
jgi:DNA-3-methyladenine glycosylase